MHHPDRNICLLNLLPGNPDDPIRCTIRVVSLDQYPSYEAVSYVWGDPKEEKEIKVSDRDIPVTKSLWAGLQRLRYPTEERTLWIDQLCINQWDKKEKARQVALMRDIYKQCTRCVTWMGELRLGEYIVAPQDAEAVFDFLRQVAAARTTSMQRLPVFFEDTREGRDARNAFRVFSMFGNPWWSRIWTVQEAIVPTAGVLVWGPLSISQQDVLQAAQNLRDIQELSGLPMGFTSSRHEFTSMLRTLLYPVHGFNHSKIDGPLNLLMRWRHRKATDQHDKVYALLGLMPADAIPSAQACDYTIPVSALFAKVTLDLIRSEGSLRPLVGACDTRHVTADMPTWAIDFASTNRLGLRQMTWWNHSHRYEQFSADKNRPLELLESPDGTSIQLTGVHVDDILETRELLHIEPYQPIYPADLGSPLESCSALIEQYRNSHDNPPVYKDGYSWASAFCRTMVGDLIMDEFPLDRVSAYGRSAAQHVFSDLFSDLQVPTPALDLDFAEPISAAEELQREQKRRSARAARTSQEDIPDREVLRCTSETGYAWEHGKGKYVVFNELYESLVGMMEKQTFFVTKSGYMGIGPEGTRAGDQVWVFHGGNVPFVMRKVGKGEEGDAPLLKLVGNAYVHGIMDGEALDGEARVQKVCVR
jgi:hypothetical protein